MSACDKHKANPVKGYSQCAGCEVEALQAERDTLRQQLAARDADAERWRYYAPEVARRVGATLEEMNATVDAALAEVKPCPESLHPAAT